jgi:hypothetical protein
MPFNCVDPRYLTHHDPVVDMMPIVLRDVCGIDAERVDGVGRLQHLLDSWPAGQVQKTLSSRLDAW